MTKNNPTTYLTQALAVLNRTAGVAPSRIRAMGFLQRRLRERVDGGEAGSSTRKRPRAPMPDGPRPIDRG